MLVQICIGKDKLAVPQGLPQIIHEMLLQCFQHDPNKRPSAKEIFKVGLGPGFCQLLLICVSTSWQTGALTILQDSEAVLIYSPTKHAFELLGDAAGSNLRLSQGHT